MDSMRPRTRVAVSVLASQMGWRTFSRWAVVMSFGSSPASEWARRQPWGDRRLPGGGRFWTPTTARPFAMGHTWGKVVGRWIPWVGWGLLIGDAAAIADCIADCDDGPCQ